jgi:hypothetical protein
MHVFFTKFMHCFSMAFVAVGYILGTLFWSLWRVFPDGFYGNTFSVCHFAELTWLFLWPGHLSVLVSQEVEACPLPQHPEWWPGRDLRLCHWAGRALLVSMSDFSVEQICGCPLRTCGHTDWTRAVCCFQVASWRSLFGLLLSLMLCLSLTVALLIAGCPINSLSSC